MTSPSTDAPTQEHFAQHNHFGLDSKQFFFFQQVSTVEPECLSQPRISASTSGIKYEHINSCSCCPSTYRHA